MLLGVHCSIAGGVINAFNEAKRLGIDTFQIFTKNQRQWREKTIEQEEGNSFRTKLTEEKIKVCFSHATYLINLASSDEQIRLNSIAALEGELLRCHQLGLSYSVLHPGAAKNLKENEAIAKISEGLRLILGNTKGLNVKILLENTAGQGSSIGRTFGQLSEIMNQTESERVGMCLDTCHAFAAGYDIRSKDGFDDMLNEIDKTVGLGRLNAIHLNDSKGKLGSRIDRHENIGNGQLGLEPFRQIMQRFQHLPKVLETPKENNMDEVNLKVLRGLL